MGRPDIEPLEPAHWFARFRSLQARTLDDPNVLGASLRHAFHLVQLAPRPLRHIVRCDLTELQFEELLLGDQFFPAVLALVAPALEYSVLGGSSRNEVRAEVWEQDGHNRFCGEGEAPESALCKAWLNYLNWLGGAGEDTQLRVNYPNQHRYRSGQHRRPTEH